MNYLIVYDKFETAFTSMGLAVLENASSVKVREVINGEFLLTFILPRNDPKWQYLQSENFVKCYDCSLKKDQVFRIRTFEELRDATGKLTSNIQCEHAYYDSNDCRHIPSFEQIGMNPTQILTAAYAGTRFTIGTVEITTATDIFDSKTSPAKVTQKLIENVGGELVRDNWTINLLAKRGTSGQTQFRVGKNIQSLRKSTDATGIVTRLYPYGKDGLQIEGELGYIDSPLINNYDRPRVGYIDYNDIEDPAVLLAEALKEWSTSDRDGIDKPKVTYKVEVSELKKLKEYGELEAFGIGDTVRIIDESLGIDTNQRIVEYEYYPWEPQKSTVSLTNCDVKVYRESNIGSLIAGTVKAKETLKQITDNKNNVNSLYIDSIRERLQTEINGMIQKALVHNQCDMYVDNLDAPTKAILFGGGLFAIANSKKLNGDWNWTTIANGDRVIATEVDAEWVYAGTINADNIVGGSITGITIQTDEEGNPRIVLNEDGFAGYNTDDHLHGIVIEKSSENQFADVKVYNDGNEYFRIYFNLPGVTLKAPGEELGEMKNVLSSWGGVTRPENEWDFSATPVKGVCKTAAGDKLGLNFTVWSGENYLDVYYENVYKGSIKIP